MVVAYMIQFDHREIKFARSQVAFKKGSTSNCQEKCWNEMIEDPWMGIYKINDDKPITVNEHFMSDTEVAASLVQFRTESVCLSDSLSESSLLLEHEHLSEFESDDDFRGKEIM